MICVAIKDGKIRIAKIGKPFFPEPLNEKTIVVKENEELFLVGSYPDQNTIILNFDKYKTLVKELKQHCPGLLYWKISCFVLIGFVILLVGICCHFTGVFSKALKFLKQKK